MHQLSCGWRSCFCCKIKREQKLCPLSGKASHVATLGMHSVARCVLVGTLVIDKYINK